MSNGQDNKLCGPHLFQRNNYFYGKLMTVRDFEVEQSYMNEKRHLLNQFVHGLGLVCGFKDIEPKANSAGEVELEDGSIISGEIVSYKDGVYTISSSSLGTVEISESKIRSIHYSSQHTQAVTPNRTTNPGVSSEMQTLQSSMMNNEDIMRMIRSLQNDPKVQEVLNDPDIMNAVLAGDINALMSNPKFLELLNHPKVLDIQRNMAK